MRFRLYVDESGDHTYKNLDITSRRYLGLTGIAIESDYYRTDFQPSFEALKQRHFPHNPDDPVILHREDIYNRRHEFGILSDPAKNVLWENDFISFVSGVKYELFTVILDKRKHRTNYGSAAIHPYHLCLTFLLERYRGFLNNKIARGDVLAESRGKNEDFELRGAYRKVYHGGTYYISAQQFQRALTSNEIKTKGKSSNIAGLQFADLLAHPSKMYILQSQGVVANTNSPFGRRLYEAFRGKYSSPYGQKIM